MTGVKGPPEWTEKVLDMLGKRVDAFKRMPVDTFDEHCKWGLYVLKSHLHDHIMEDRRKFETVSILVRSPYEHFKVPIDHLRREALQRRQTRMIEIVDILQRAY